MHPNYVFLFFLLGVIAGALGTNWSLRRNLRIVNELRYRLITENRELRDRIEMLRVRPWDRN